MKALNACALCLLLLVVGCSDKGQEPDALSYATAKVERRTLEVSVEAAGVVEPRRTVEVKSKASGEILELRAETGAFVERGALLVRIDPRTPGNRVAQAEADLNAAEARLVRATTQLERAKKLLGEKWLNQADYDQNVLDAATAQSQVVSARVAVENARITLEDTEIRAPISGTILTKRVERGQVISSPTQDVGGGTLLLTMASLDEIQVRARVDETDIGKVQPGMSARITVTAYPGRAFVGTIEKIEPQAVVDQNVTLFPVIVSVGNQQGLLKPGMNVEVNVDVARREDVLTVPVMALRTERDYATTATILGIEESALRARIEPVADGAAAAAPTRTHSAAPGAGGRGGGSGAMQFSGRFWVVATRAGIRVPTPVKTGLTDLDRVEVTEGLQEGDEVLLLPSASLVEVQQQLQQFVKGRMGSGLPGMTQPRPGTGPPPPAR